MSSNKLFVMCRNTKLTHIIAKRFILDNGELTEIKLA